MNKYFNITETDTDAVIEVYGEIGDSWWSEGVTLQSVSEQLKAICEKKKKCLVRINSLGGDVNEALAIFDLLRSMGDNVTTECTGMCASAATIIAMAGKVRRMSKYSLFLVHKCWSVVSGNENELEVELESQRKVNDVMAQLYADITGTEKATIEQLMNENNGDGKWLTAAEAMEYGFITEEIATEPVNVSAAFIFKTFKNLFNPKSQESMKQEEFEAKVAEVEAAKAEVETHLSAAKEANAALETEKAELQAKMDGLEQNHTKEVEQLNARIAELQAVIDQKPATVVEANGGDNNGGSFEDWYNQQDYVKEAHKELGR